MTNRALCSAFLPSLIKSEKDDEGTHSPLMNGDPRSDGPADGPDYGTTHGEEHPRIRQPVGLVQFLQNSKNRRGFVWTYTKQSWNGKGSGWRASSAVVVLVVVFFAWTIMTVAITASIATNKVALSASQDCGVWLPDDDAGDDAVYKNMVNNRQKEQHAGEYARHCYNDSESTTTLSCSFFVNRTIGFQSKSQQKCPFPLPELCGEVLYSAVTFDTGLVNANIIGINTPRNYMFRRVATCAPLTMSPPYVVQDPDDANESTYYYNYGSTEDYGWTYDTYGYPFGWPISVYSVGAQFASSIPKKNHWEPIKGLRQPANSSLTILFVTSTHILYESYSDDPIFPANTSFGYGYYVNLDPRARPLACIDTSQLCSDDGKSCWGMHDATPPDVGGDPAYWMMKWSLENSDIYKSIQWRLGTALLAQEQIGQFVSRALEKNQWELEMTQLFATSLARIQYDAWAIATAQDRGLPGYVEKTGDEALGKLCGLFKFKSTDHTNVNLAGFVCFILLALFTMVSSLDVPSKWWSRPSWSLDWDTLFITAIAGLLLSGLKWIWKVLGRVRRALMARISGPRQTDEVQQPSPEPQGET
ncbi:MAG: hypothetical protein Q9220_004022 [cf. Caloplaca sp. 1 TL-2023]